MLQLRLHPPAQFSDLGNDGVLGRLQVLLDLRLLAGCQRGARLERLPPFDRNRVASHLHHDRDGAVRVGKGGHELAIHLVERDLLELQPQVGGSTWILRGGGNRGDRDGGEGSDEQHGAFHGAPPARRDGASWSERVYETSVLAAVRIGRVKRRRSSCSRVDRMGHMPAGLVEVDAHDIQRRSDDLQTAPVNDGVDAVRDLGTALLVRLNGCRQGIADLVYQDYQSAIGGEARLVALPAPQTEIVIAGRDHVGLGDTRV